MACTDRADYLRATRKWVDPRQMRPKQPIQVTARDGLVLHGYLTTPTGEAPHPLVGEGSYHNIPHRPSPYYDIV